jgi:hypothetical protein
MLRVAELDPSTGAGVEVARTAMTSLPAHLEIAAVAGRILIFSSESVHGLQIYEFRPPQTLVAIASIAGQARHAAVRGPSDSPILLLHMNDVGSAASRIDLFDTAWLSTGSAPTRIASLGHFLSGVPFRGMGFEALYSRSGTTSMLYLYRELTPDSIRTDAIDVSCAVP